MSNARQKSSFLLQSSSQTPSAQDADGKTVDLSKYKGKVVLIVNVASQCGYTPQYKELAALYDKYSNQGFVILGFPCNQVGHNNTCTHPNFAQSSIFPFVLIDFHANPALLRYVSGEPRVATDGIMLK